LLERRNPRLVRALKPIEELMMTAGALLRDLIGIRNPSAVTVLASKRAKDTRKIVDYSSATG
jgi:hypothetical protein